MKKKNVKKCKTRTNDDWDLIRNHLFLACHELLLAAKQVANLCKSECLFGDSPDTTKILDRTVKLTEEFSTSMAKSKSFSELANDMLIPIIKSKKTKKKKVSKRRNK